MENENSGLLRIFGGLGVIVVLGTVGYFFSTQSNQKKWSFEDWVQKSDVSLSYFENFNKSSKGTVFPGENWWEFKRFVLDWKERNCLEEFKQLGVINRNENVRRFPNCRVGTLDYLIGRYLMYNPGGSIPYGVSGELTIVEGGKETKGRSQTSSNNVFIDKIPSDQTNTPTVKIISGLPHITQTPSSVPQQSFSSPPSPTTLSVPLKNGMTYTVSRNNVHCKLVKLSYQISDNYGPSYTILCSISGVLEDLTGKKNHLFLDFYHDIGDMGFFKYPQGGQCFESKRIYRSVDSGLEYRNPKQNKSTKCSLVSKFNLIKPLKVKGDKWLKSERDRWLEWIKGIDP